MVGARKSQEWAQYADEHGTAAQRFYNTLCLAYGGEREWFQDFIDKGWLPKERAKNGEMKICGFN